MKNSSFIEALMAENMINITTNVYLDDEHKKLGNIDRYRCCNDGHNILGDDRYHCNHEELHEIDDNYEYYNNKLNEALDSFETTLATFISTSQKPCSEEEEETKNLKSFFQEIKRVKVSINLVLSYVVEGSEMSQVLRVGMEGMNTWLYNAAVNTDSGCFIKEGLLKIVQVMNEEEGGNCCAICLDGMKSGDVRGRIEYCGHDFHFVCLNLWMKRMHSCPVCRYEMDENHQLFIPMEIV